LRVGIAAIVLMAVLQVRNERLPREAATWRALLVQSLFSATASWPLLAWGAQRIDASLAGVLNSTSPIWVFFITALITRHEPLTLLKFAGAAGGLLGVGLVIGWSAAGSAGADTPGQLAAVGSAILYACAAVWGTRYAGVPVTAVAAGTMLWSTACLVPLSLVLEQPWTLRPSAQALAATLYLGVLPTAVALLLYFRLVRTLGSLGVASQAYLRAGWSVLLGAVLLGEALGIQVLIGLAAIIVAVTAINRRS
jgi:drug/metabolite transporter (DMT)-like permease